MTLMCKDGFSVNLGVSINGGYPQMDGLIEENPLKMDDLGVPPFMEAHMS